MTDHLKEQLSALVDDHLPEREQELLVTRLTRDKGLADCWRRYHLISDGIRKQLPEHFSNTVAERVKAALVDEQPVVGSSGRGSSSTWMKPLAGLAVAASVAVVAILGVRTMQLSDTAPMLASAPVDSGQARMVQTQTAQIQVPQSQLSKAQVSQARVTQAHASQAQAPRELVRLQGVRWNVSKPRVADQLNRYLVDHSEYAASGGMPGFGPHVRIVGYAPSR